jgi:hypothetical protein
VPDQANLTKVLCTSSYVVSGDVATPTGASPCTYPAGSTDPVFLTPVTGPVTMTFTMASFSVSGSMMHETFAAVHADGSSTCTFSGQSDYTNFGD